MTTSISKSTGLNWRKLRLINKFLPIFGVVIVITTLLQLFQLYQHRVSLKKYEKKQLEFSLVSAVNMLELNANPQEQFFNVNFWQQWLRISPYQLHSLYLVDASQNVVSGLHNEKENRQIPDSLITGFNLPGTLKFGQKKQLLLYKQTSAVYITPIARSDKLWTAYVFLKYNASAYYNPFHMSYFRDQFLYLGFIILFALISIVLLILERKWNPFGLHTTYPESFYRSLIESLPIHFFAKDLKGRFIFVNQFSSRVEGKSIEEMIGKNDYDIHPKDLARKYREDDKRVIETEKVFETIEEHQMANKKTDRKFVQVVKAPVYDMNGFVRGVMGIYWDITDQVESYYKIERALQEKEILLQEVHHRVKNNLQIICSLLNLQTQNIKDKKSRTLLLDNKNRVRSMALIHERLYQSDSVANLDFRTYVYNLAHDIFYAYGIEPGKIDLETKVENVKMDINIAIPCGLMLNELISNALKYAFVKNSGKRGKISISIYRSRKKSIKITVADNGIGLPEDLKIDQSKGMGLHLVKLLAEEQLDGIFQYGSKNGARFDITFNVD